MSTTPPLIVVPEYVIHDGLKKALAFLRADYKSFQSTGVSRSFLYRLLSGIKFQKYDYFEQAKSIFITDLGNPRHLEVDLMYNAKSDQIPSIHITTPADATDKNGIGMDEGYMEEMVITVQNRQSYSNVFTRRYTGIYDIVITDDNSNEIILIYHVLKALLNSLYFHFDASGLQNISISGNDLTPYSEIVPKNCFQRVIRLKCEYECSTLSFETMNVPVDFTFQGTVVDR